MSQAPQVYRAINAIQAELCREGITKTRVNTAQSYKFRGIDDVYNALSPLMAQHGLCIMPRMLTRDCQERVSEKGKPLFYVTVEAEFDFVSTEDGSRHVVRTFGEAMDSADKATNKAMSAAYKYAAFQAFAIPTEGDNDADAHTPAVAPKPKYPEMVAMSLAQSVEALQILFDIAYARAKAAGDQEGGRKLIDLAKIRKAALSPISAQDVSAPDVGAPDDMAMEDA
jgi:hypothetical protein